MVQGMSNEEILGTSMRLFPQREKGWKTPFDMRPGVKLTPDLVNAKTGKVARKKVRK